MVTAKVEAVHTAWCSASMWCSQGRGSDSRPLYLLVRHTVLHAAFFTLRGDPYLARTLLRRHGGYARTPSTSPSSSMIAIASSSPVASSDAARRPMTKTQVLSRQSRRRALRLGSQPLRRPSLRHFFRPRRWARLQARPKSPRVWSICLCRSARRQQTA
jgi:hypothetical protein